MSDRASLLAIASFALALVAGAIMLALPIRGETVRTTVSGRADPSGTTVFEPPQTTREVTQRSALEVHGPRILVLLAIPVAVTAIPVALGRTRFARHARITAAVGLGALVMLAIASLGMAYLPALAAMIAAAASGPARHPA